MFKMIYTQESWGTQLIDLKLPNIKLFVNLQTIFTLQDFFVVGMPNYVNKQEVPQSFDQDIENIPRMEVNIHLDNPMICFEQLIREPESSESGTVANKFSQADDE